jgi:hypothetical protein
MPEKIKSVSTYFVHCGVRPLACVEQKNQPRVISETMWTRRASQAVKELTVSIIERWRGVTNLDIIHYNVEEK